MQCSMAWALHRTEKEKPAAGKTDYWRGFWRSGWDSNPRNLAVQLISSQSRYDHFDTAPYLSQHQNLGKRGELMGRTSKNIKLRIPEKPHKIKGFRSGSYRVATTISSQGRYNHFDTTPRGAERVSACYYSRRRAENQAFRCACGAVRGKFFRGCNFCLPFSSLSVQRDGARPRRGAPRAKS